MSSDSSSSSEEERNMSSITWCNLVANTDLLKHTRKRIKVIHCLLCNDPRIGQGMADLIMQGDHAGIKERMEQHIMKKEGYTGHVMAATIFASTYFKRTYTLQKGQSGGTNPQRTSGTPTQETTTTSCGAIWLQRRHLDFRP